MNYTTRSWVESFQSCPRYRYNEQFLLDKGLVAKRQSVPLVTGTAIHEGIAHILGRTKQGWEVNVDIACELAVTRYIHDCEDAGFSGRGMEEDRQQKFTFGEQKALIEALIRAWHLREYPRLLERYKVLAVEREIEPIQLIDDIYWMARVDAEFQDVTTQDYVNYSIKSCKTWDERMEDSYKSDLQGVTEIWSCEKDSERQIGYLKNVEDNVKGLLESKQYPEKNLNVIRDWAAKQLASGPKKVMGIRFCYLVKGKQYTYDDIKYTVNPLIRGYRNVTPGGIEYAHSYYYPNPENKSGKSQLGKGWEPFNVWESSISIKDWINVLAEGKIQPDCGDVVKQYVVTPPEYFRDQHEMDEAIKEITYQEKRIFNLLGEPLEWTFPHNRKQCNYMFGDRCQYYKLCWSPEVRANPLESGLYTIRTPHHETEQ